MPKIPPFELTTRLVARSLGFSPDQLLAALRPVTLAELDQVAHFRRQHLGNRIRWDDPRYLRWRYRLADDGQGFGPLWALWREGAPVGLIGAEDLPLAGAGQTCTAQRLMDLLIDPALHDSGLGAWLNQALFRHAPMTLAIGANEQSAGLVQRLFDPLPPLRPAIRPIRLRAVARRSGSPLQRLAPLAPLADATLAAWAHTMRHLAGPGLRWAPITRFDDRADGFRPDGSEICAVRNGDYLNRRLLANPRVAVEVTGLFAGDALLGYMAWRRIVTDRAHELRILDWQFDPQVAHRGWLAGLSAATVRARDLGCDSVRVLLQDPQTAGLRRLGFLSPPRALALRVGCHVRADAQALAARWGSTARWRLTEVSDDNDAD